MTAKMGGSPQSKGLILWEPRISVQKKKNCANLFTVVDVEIFHKRGEALPVALEEKSWGK